MKRPSPRVHLAIVAALVVPFGTAALHAGDDHGADCDDAVAATVHELEEATGLTPLHVVEEIYCAVLGD